MIWLFIVFYFLGMDSPMLSPSSSANRNQIGQTMKTKQLEALAPSSVDWPSDKTGADSDLCSDKGHFSPDNGSIGSTEHSELHVGFDYPCQLSKSAAESKIHTEDKNHTCRICSKNFHVKFDLERHMMIHRKYKPFSCDICGSKWISKERLERHRQCHSTTNMETKQLDPIKATSDDLPSDNIVADSHLSSYKDKHFSSCERSNESTEHSQVQTEFDCRVQVPKSASESISVQKRKPAEKQTDKSTSSEMSNVPSNASTETMCVNVIPDENRAVKNDKHYATFHRRKHLELRKMCDVCGKSFCTEGYLRYHKQSVHEGIKHHCDICGVGFTFKMALYAHRKIHTGERNHVCHICSKRFRLKSDLKQHIMAHNNEKPFSCNICGSKWITRYKLERHKRSHTLSKPYQCTICGKEFTTNYSLKYHMKKLHSC